MASSQYSHEALLSYNDANKLLDYIINEKWLTAQGAIGFWPAGSDGKDTIVVNNNGGAIYLESLRQQIKKAPGFYLKMLLSDLR